MLRFHLYSFLFSALQPALLLQVKKRSGMTRAMNKGLWISSSPNFPNQAMSHFSLTSARQKNCFCFLFHFCEFTYILCKWGLAGPQTGSLFWRASGIPWNLHIFFVSTWFILFGCVCVFFFLVFFYWIFWFLQMSCSAPVLDGVWRVSTFERVNHLVDMEWGIRD